MLVRLRPSWEELKVYLLAKGRKRFEAFICTMSERDYALEMWRLLDPDARLINPRELNERVTCVKSGMTSFPCLVCQEFLLDFHCFFSIILISCVWILESLAYPVAHDLRIRQKWRLSWRTGTFVLDRNSFCSRFRCEKSA